MREEERSADTTEASASATSLYREQRDGSRTPSQDGDDSVLPPLNSSRGVEAHRADPALRQALENLDAVRSNEPTMDDFALENYIGHRPQRSSTNSGGQDVQQVGGDRQGGPKFSLDLLFAALPGHAPIPSNVPIWLESGGSRRRDEGASPTSSATSWPTPVQQRQLGPLLMDTSRSTSPGSTQVSCFSESVGSLSSGAGNDLPTAEKVLPPSGRPPRRPMLPSAPPPRQGSRHRADSVRARRVQAAVESAAADLAAYATPHSAR